MSIDMSARALLYKHRIPMTFVFTGVVWFSSLAGASANSSVANAAAETNPHVWQPRVRSVSVFKNGLGFFVRDGDVTLHNGWCVAEEIPPAKFGTFAIYAHSESEIVDIVGAGPGETIEFDGRDAPNTLAARMERLGALKNVSVSLMYLRDGNELESAGRLISVSEEFAMLDTDVHTIAVPVSSISRIHLLDLPLRVHVSASDGSPDGPVKLGMAYLRDGISWIPEYSLELLDDHTAELTLRGTIVNDAEDLIHTDVNLIVGVPHFEHSSYLAPIAVGRMIRSLGAAIAPPDIRSQIMSRAAIAQNSTVARQSPDANGGWGYRDMADAGGGSMTAQVPAVYDGSAGDYAVYTLSDLTIRRGEKAIVTLFRSKIEYKDIYEWSPPQQIAHLIKLRNTMDTPWTTGPVVMLENDRPLGEDLLRYTPIAASCEVPVTSAVNLTNNRAETEVDRVLKAHEPSRNRFLDLVTLEGILEIKNFGTDPVEITIKTDVAGLPISASDEGLVSTDSSKLILTERNGSLRWNLVIASGDSKTLRYRYERYVSSG